MTTFEWPGLDRPTEKKKENPFIETSKLAQRVFSTEDGEKLLKHFITKFKDVTVAHPGDKESYAFFREGQRDVVFYIEKLLNTAKEHRE